MLPTEADERISKSLSYWLRHDPSAGGLELDPSGWAEISGVLVALKEAGRPHNRIDLMRVVEQSEKNRFEVSEDGSLIRARQGHSVPVDLDWPLAEPPEFLFHGTVERFCDQIFAEGLKPMARHHVHLSPDAETAAMVGARRGRPVTLRIAAAELSQKGHQFRRSSNGVWLTDHIPPRFITRT